MVSILEKPNLGEFMSRWAAVEPVDVVRAEALAKSELKYVKGNQGERDQYFQLLEKSWYQSLPDLPNYAIYSDPYMLVHIWACWIVYSRKYLLALRLRLLNSIGDVNSVADLGCGCGYTTAALKELFPKAEVHGTQLEGNSQWKMATAIGNERGFAIVPSPRNAELVFASEYFEHFENPVEHLREVLSACNPQRLIIANSFGAVSLGHFREYQYRYRCRVPGNKMGRLFNEALRESGYESIDAGLWNSRPAYWRKRI